VLEDVGILDNQLMISDLVVEEALEERVEHLLRLGGIDNTRNSDRGLDLDWIAQVADDQPRNRDLDALLTTIADPPELASLVASESMSCAKLRSVTK